jgi:hypothetical protein
MHKSGEVAKMKKKICVLLLLLITMSPLASVADDDRWVWIGADDKMGLFFDKETIKKTNDHLYPKSYSVWVKNQYTEAYSKEVVEKYFDKDTAKYRGLSYILTLWQIDIESSDYRVIQFTYYSDNNELIESSSDKHAEWKSAVPGSIGEAVVKAIVAHLDKA